MNHQTEIAEKTRIQTQKDMVIRMVRISGLAIIAFGLAIFFNIGNIAGILSLNDGGINKVLGGALMFTGLADIVIVPRILGHKKTI